MTSRVGVRAAAAGPTPDSIAKTTSWARSRACSFTIARETWVRTVSGLTTSASAISWLDRPVATQRDDLALALGELGQPRVRRVAGRRPDAELLDHPPGDARREQRAAVGHDPDRVEQRGRLGVLEQEAAGAVPQRLEDVLVELERRQHDHPDVGQRRGRAATSASRPSPSSTGIRMSQSTTSGRARRTSSSPSRPSPASPTSSRPASDAIRVAQAHPDQRLVVDDARPGSPRPGAHSRQHRAHLEAAGRRRPGRADAAERLDPLRASRSAPCPSSPALDRSRRPSSRRPRPSPAVAGEREPRPRPTSARRAGARW